MRQRDIKVSVVAALARMGYTARGLVYNIVGALAVLTAVGLGGATTDSKGAIREISQQPFGQVLLVLLLLGLAGYIIWRSTQALLDTDGHGSSVKGLGVRLGLLISAVTHTALATFTLKLLLPDSTSDSGQPTWLSSEPGLWLLVAVGAGTVIAGGAHIVKGWRLGFEKFMRLPASQLRWMRPLCRFGLVACGAVLILIGVMLAHSATVAHSAEVKGVADALQKLRETPLGAWWLGIVAVGLLAFGCYSWLEAIFRQIESQHR